MSDRNVMYVEDCDDEDQPISHTQTYADGVYPPSPSKEKPNTGKTRSKESLQKAKSSTEILTNRGGIVVPVKPSTRKNPDDSPTQAAQVQTKTKTRVPDEIIRANIHDRGCDVGDSIRREKGREETMRESEFDPDMEASKPRDRLLKKVPIRARPMLDRKPMAEPILHRLLENPARQPQQRHQPYGAPLQANPALGPRIETRPMTYHGPPVKPFVPVPNPPPSNSGWWATQSSYHTPVTLSSPFLPTSYGFQPWPAGPPSISPAGPPAPQIQIQVSSPEVYTSSSQNYHLASRFQSRPPTNDRPGSVMSSHDTQPLPASHAIVRRRSSGTRREGDWAQMPPPPRQLPAMRQGPPLSCHSSQYFQDDNCVEDEATPFKLSPFIPTHDLDAAFHSRPQRESTAYDVEGDMVEPASASLPPQRQSYYKASYSVRSGLVVSQACPPNDYEDKLQRATAYQETKSGPASNVPLTKENVLRAAKRSSGNDSRSTRSSSSRDDSEYRKSNTTRTTRSASDDDVTITVTGAAFLKIQGAEIQCQDGGEINIRQGGGRLSAGLSHKSSTILTDDNRSRLDQNWSNITRAPSQSGSRSRGHSMPQQANASQYGGRGFI